MFRCCFAPTSADATDGEKPTQQQTAAASRPDAYKVDAAAADQPSQADVGVPARISADCISPDRSSPTSPAIRPRSSVPDRVLKPILSSSRRSPLGGPGKRVTLQEPDAAPASEDRASPRPKIVFPKSGPKENLEQDLLRPNSQPSDVERPREKFHSQSGLPNKGECDVPMRACALNLIHAGGFGSPRGSQRGSRQSMNLQMMESSATGESQIYLSLCAISIALLCWHTEFWGKMEKTSSESGMCDTLLLGE